MDGLEQRINNIKIPEPVKPATPTEPSNPIIQQSKSGVDEEVIKELEDKISGLNEDLDSFKSEILKWLKEMQDQMNGKLDRDELKQFEQDIYEKINDIVKQLQQTLADKGETKKAFKVLEKQIKKLYDFIMSRQNNNGSDVEDDAMFTKKPLAGTSCASCEKGVSNLQGIKAQFFNWQMFPFRDPTQRIFKTGQGFSNRLKDGSWFASKVAANTSFKQSQMEYSGYENAFSDDQNASGLVGDQSNATMMERKSPASLGLVQSAKKQRRATSSQGHFRPNSAAQVGFVAKRRNIVK